MIVRPTVVIVWAIIVTSQMYITLEDKPVGTHRI